MGGMNRSTGIARLTAALVATVAAQAFVKVLLAHFTRQAGARVQPWVRCGTAMSSISITFPEKASRCA